MGSLNGLTIITARKRSLGLGNVSTGVGVCLGRGVCLGGVCLEWGSAYGGSAQGGLPGGVCLEWGSAQGGLHPEGGGWADPLPRDTVLLECILVEQIFTAADCLRCMNILFGPMMSP